MRQTQKIILGIFKIILFFLFVSGSFNPGITTAMEYFVAKDGNDAQPGTKSSPVQTIRRGISLMSKGDTLYISEGTYEEVIRSQEFPIPTGTSWDNAPVIAAYPGELVTLRPSGAWEIIGLSRSDIQYVIFDGLILDGIKLNPSSGMGISMTNGANHVRFRNMEVKNAPFNNVLLTPGTGGTDFNEFIGGKYHDAGWSPDLKQAYNFYIATNHNIVDGAEVYNATGYGFHIYNSVSPRPSYNIVRNCRIHSNSTQVISSAGILLGSGIGNMAYNNLVYNGRGHGIQVGNGANNSLVYNNTIYDNDENGIAVGNGTGGAINTIIKNNISHKNRNNYYDIGTGTIHSANLIDGTDPLFVDPINWDFHLKSGETYKNPAIDAGLSLVDITVDFEGNARPQGSGYDIGALESNHSTIGIPKNARILAVK